MSASNLQLRILSIVKGTPMRTVGTIDHSRLGLRIASIGRAASLGLESSGMKALQKEDFTVTSVVL